MTASIKLALNSAVMHVDNDNDNDSYCVRIRAVHGAFASKPHEHIR